MGRMDAKHLGAEMKAHRERAGLGVRELAQMAGVSASAVSRWETGERTPTVEHLEAWAQVVSAQVELLIWHTEDDPRTGLVALIGRAPSEDVELLRQLAATLPAMSTRERSALSAYLHALRDGK